MTLTAVAEGNNITVTVGIANAVAGDVYTIPIITSGTGGIVVMDSGVNPASTDDYTLPSPAEVTLTWDATNSVSTSFNIMFPDMENPLLSPSTMCLQRA